LTQVDLAPRGSAKVVAHSRQRQKPIEGSGRRG